MPPALPPLLPPGLEVEPPEEPPPELDGFDGLDEPDGGEWEGIWQAPSTRLRAMALAILSTGPAEVGLIWSVIKFSLALGRGHGIQGFVRCVFGDTIL